MKQSHLLSSAAAALLANVAFAQHVFPSFSLSDAGSHPAWPGQSGLNGSEHGQSFSASTGGQSWPGSYSWTFDLDDAHVGREFEQRNEWERTSADMDHGQGRHHVDQYGDFSSGHWNDSGLFPGGASAIGSPTSGSLIPEPSTYAAVLGLAALGLAVSRRRVSGRAC